MDEQKEKHELVAEYLLGGTSTRKLGIKYGYSHTTVCRWVMAQKKYGKKQPQPFDKEISQADGLMPTDIKELQEALRLSRIQIELLETMIDISDKEFGTDIRKKAGTGRS